MTLGGDIIIEQDGVPGIFLNTLGISHFILKNLDLPAVIGQSQITPTILGAVLRPQPLRQRRKIERRHFFLQELQGYGKIIPFPAHPVLLLRRNRIRQGQGLRR